MLDTSTPELPSNLEAEAALLGALMINNRILDHIGDRLAPEDFFEPLHSRIYESISIVVAKGQVASPVTLKLMFQDDPAINDVGGTSYLGRLTEHSAALVAYDSFAKEIGDLARRRRGIVALMSTVAELRKVDADVSVNAIAERGDIAFNTAMLGAAVSNPGVMLNSLLGTTMKSIEDEAEGRVEPGVTTALLPDWNAITGGMRGGEVTVLAARPKMGKTATAISIALGAAMNGHGTAYLSFEMRAVELGKRMISDLMFDHGNCPSYNDIKRGELNREDRHRFEELRAASEKWPLKVIDQRAVKLGKIAMMIRRLKREFDAKGTPLKLVVLDYLQLIRPDKQRSRYEDVGEISRTIKEISGELDVHILLLAQVNRECEKREDKRPMPHDLRDAGDIEQDADTICFLYRDEYYLKLAEPAQFTPGYEAWVTKLQAATDRIEIYSAARRNGETMRKNCHFFAANQAVRGSDYFRDRNL